MTGGDSAAFAVDQSRRHLYGLFASLALVAVAVVLAISGAGGGRKDDALGSSARIVTPAELPGIAESLGHSVYWVGARGDLDLELATEADGSTYLRYLPAGTEAGDPRQTFLTVGTYPVVDAQAALRRTAEDAGVRLQHLKGGAVVLRNPSSRGSVYLAYPEGDLEIEVYDPHPGRSLALIRSGAIEPVGE